MRCYDCGLEYGGDGWIETIIPNFYWNLIRPEGCGLECGILCISCIAQRLNKLGIKKVPVWLVGTEPLIAYSGEPTKEDMIK